MNPEARVRIGRIEDNGATIHISLWGADIPDTGGAIASPLVAGHLPITADALRASVDRQVDDTPPGDLGFDEGFATWREARGGVFTLTVPEIVNVMLRTVQQGQARSK